MICKNLPTIIVITKNNDIFSYAIEDNINFEDINTYMKNVFGDKLKEIKLDRTIGYLKKANYEK